MRRWGKNNRRLLLLLPSSLVTIQIYLKAGASLLLDGGAGGVEPVEDNPVLVPGHCPLEFKRGGQDAALGGERDGREVDGLDRLKAVEPRPLAAHGDFFQDLLAQEVLAAELLDRHPRQVVLSGPGLHLLRVGDDDGHQLGL